MPEQPADIATRLLEDEDRRRQQLLDDERGRYDADGFRIGGPVVYDDGFTRYE